MLREVATEFLEQFFKARMRAPLAATEELVDLGAEAIRGKTGALLGHGDCKKIARLMLSAVADALEKEGQGAN